MEDQIGLFLFPDTVLLVSIRNVVCQGNKLLLLRRKKIRILFAVLTLFATPLIIEFGARIVYSIRAGSAAYLHYPEGAPLALSSTLVEAVTYSITDPRREQPGTHIFEVNGRPLHSLPINKSGFRGKDLYDPQKAKYRIVTMGGSSTFSSECPVGTSYPEVLEISLNEKLGNNEIEVINRGMNGMSTHEVAGLFSKEVANQSSTLVTVCSAFNALDNPLILDFRKGSSPWHLRMFWGKSLFYTALYNNIRMRRSHGPDHEQFVTETYRKDLESIAQTARLKNIKLLFIQQPLLDASKVDLKKISDRVVGEDIRSLLDGFAVKVPMQKKLAAIMKKVAQKNSIPLVDPRPALEDAPEPEQYFWIALHLTPKGSQVMASEIDRQVEEHYGGWEKLFQKLSQRL